MRRPMLLQGGAAALVVERPRQEGGIDPLPERGQELDVLAALSHQADFSVGCYCADESRCHRSVLRELLLERGAEIT